MTTLSPRLAAIVEALPVRPGMRVIEIGGAPGAAARALVRRVEGIHVLLIDRSARGIALTQRKLASEIEAGMVRLRHVAAEDFVLDANEQPYDLAFAVRVGAFDGRHPRAGERARARIAAALRPGARLLVDGGSPLREIYPADAPGSAS
ncbi:SAM-dependent methyltransferase [Nocardioides thalensis]|uniref:SAM-dependent methyltransferase n=1 Tax=Nocardioides thalensis TaxID=1914755 RepID=A0A853C3T7_9ACTN|nr:methyltransferase domain-containing protein [Nocardioides thalensis]NYJ01676.1 SAM-dependent methyltransferase [Nocardioides thalensis]